LIEKYSKITIIIICTSHTVQNYYTEYYGKYYFINGNMRQFDLRESLERNANGTNVQGCGLVMDTNDKLAIFFTFNGKLKGQFGDGLIAVGP
jgi:hypothetical protein